MASECAVLGTPAIYINTMEAGSIDEQEAYGLVYHYRNGEGVLEKTKELLNDTLLYDKINNANKKLIDENIDVTRFLIDFISNYPQSISKYNSVKQ